MPYEKDTYRSRINIDLAETFESETLKQLMHSLNPKLGDTIQGIFVRNQNTSSLLNWETPLLQARGLYLGKKKLIQQTYRLGSSSSYEEKKRYMKSSAVARHLSQTLPETPVVPLQL